jgi:hypothetical protein
VISMFRAFCFINLIHPQPIIHADLKSLETCTTSLPPIIEPIYVSGRLLELIDSQLDRQKCHSERHELGDLTLVDLVGQLSERLHCYSEN